MENETRTDLRCDVLLLFATSSERDMLEKAAKELGLQFVKRKVEGPHGEKVPFFLIGLVGSSKVNAMQTEMGPFSYGGSASRAIYYRFRTGATSIIQLGMAFGADPENQKIGDVLVSTSLIPYDLRIVRPVSMPAVEYPQGILESEATLQAETTLRAQTALEPEESLELQAELRPKSETVAVTRKQRPDQTARPAGEAYRVDYSPASRHRAKDSLVRMFTTESERGECKHRVFFGGMLSGGARIFSRRFLGELVKGVPQAEDGVIGGEMEGIGLLSVSPPDDPLWVVVKGISDFADEDRDAIIKTTRPIACVNSARFVLSALIHSSPDGCQS